MCSGRCAPRLFGLGGLQVAGTAAIIAAVGLILAMSSTAIVLQTLQERGPLKTPAGEASFAVLLFQDIAVIPGVAG